MQQTTLTVRGYHIDVYGHVNNARYLEFMEDGRWALFSSMTDLNAWAERGLAFVVVNINIDYRRAAHMHDVLTLTTRLVEIGSRNAVLEQQFHHQVTGQLVASARVTFVVVDTRVQKAISIEGEMLDLLQRMLAAGQA